MEAAELSETFVPVCQTMLRRNLGDNENFRCQEVAFMTLCSQIAGMDPAVTFRD